MEDFLRNKKAQYGADQFAILCGALGLGLIFLVEYADPVLKKNHFLKKYLWDAEYKKY